MSRRKDRLARIKWANEQMVLRTQMRDKIATLTQERDAAMAAGAYLKSELDRRKIPTIEAREEMTIVDVVPPPRDRLMQIARIVPPVHRHFDYSQALDIRAQIAVVEFQEMRTALRNGMQIRWWMPVSRD